MTSYFVPSPITAAQAANLDAKVSSRTPTLGGGGQVYPSASGGAAPATGVGIWANGAYVQLTPATSAAGYLAAVTVDDNVAADLEGELDVATGAAGSEVVQYTVRFGHKLRTDAGFRIRRLSTPLVPIPNGSRVAVRARDSNGADTLDGVAVEIANA